jgi:DNA-binding transcriptional ArsR family regulator
MPKAVRFPQGSDDSEDLVAKLRLGTSEHVSATIGGPSTTEGPRRRSRTREADPFVIVPIRDLTSGAGVLDSAGEMLVWLYVLRERRMKGSKPVAVTNAGLAAWGVDRRTKYRTLEKLENAGLIRVERRGKSSPLVSLEHVR